MIKMRKKDESMVEECVTVKVILELEICVRVLMKVCDVNKSVDLGLKTKVEMGFGLFGCGLQVCEIEDEVGSVCGVCVTSSTVKVSVDWEQW